MSGVPCDCGKREAWRVAVRLGNFSWFSGGSARHPVKTPSDYSEVLCARHRGGCGRRWRTKARYVAELPNGDDCAKCWGSGECRVEVPETNPHAPFSFRIEKRACDNCGGTGEGRVR